MQTLDNPEFEKLLELLNRSSAYGIFSKNYILLPWIHTSMMKAATLHTIAYEKSLINKAPSYPWCDFESLFGKNGYITELLRLYLPYHEATPRHFFKQTQNIRAKRKVQQSAGAISSQIVKEFDVNDGLVYSLDCLVTGLYTFYFWGDEFHLGLDYLAESIAALSYPDCAGFKKTNILGNLRLTKTPQFLKEKQWQEELLASYLA